MLTMSVVTADPCTDFCVLLILATCTWDMKIIQSILFRHELVTRDDSCYVFYLSEVCILCSFNLYINE